MKTEALHNAYAITEYLYTDIPTWGLCHILDAMEEMESFAEFYNFWIAHRSEWDTDTCKKVKSVVEFIRDRKKFMKPHALDFIEWFCLFIGQTEVKELDEAERKELAKLANYACTMEFVTVEGLTEWVEGLSTQVQEAVELASAKAKEQIKQQNT